MDMKAEFLRIMRTQTDMVIATSIEGQPNVRIVNFYFDDAAGILYFQHLRTMTKYGKCLKICMLHSQPYRMKGMSI